MRKNVIYGLTHDDSGVPIVRIPRLVKVGIGRPSGKDIHVFIEDRGEHAGEWCVQVADQVKYLKSRKDAEEFYAKWWPKAGDLNRPVKLNYFTFLRTGSDGRNLVPDFDAIEKHGPKPRSISIVFTDDEPLESNYKLWSAKGLMCIGDGHDAERSVLIARADWEIELAEAAKAEGARTFPILNGCAKYGCPYFDKGDCKPNATLSFQPIAYPRLGGKAALHTTSINSIRRLNSAIYEYRKTTGGGDPRNGFVTGIPFVLTVTAKKATIPATGKPTTVYIVGLEFHNDNALLMRKRMLEAGHAWRADEAHQLEAPAASQETIDISVADDAIVPDDGDEDIPAAAIMAEFAPDVDDPLDGDDDGDPSTQPVPPTAAEQMKQATEEKQSTLAGRLRNRRGRTSATAEPAQEAATEAPAAAPAEPPREADAPTNPGTASSGDTEGAAGAGTGLFGDSQDKTWFDD